MTRARQWQGRAGRSHGLATVDGPRSAPMAPPTRSPTAGPPPPTTRARGGPRRGRAARRVSGRGWACFGGRGCGLGCRDVAGLAHTPGYVKVATVPQRTHCSSWARPSSVPGNTRNLWNRHRQRSRPNRSSAVGGSAKGCGVMATRRDRATPNDTGTAFVPSTARPCLRSAGNRDLAPAGDGVADVGVGVRGAAALPTVVLGGWFRGRWPVDLGDGFRVDLPGQVVLGSGVDRAAMHTNDAQMRLGVGCWSSGAGLVSVDAAASSAVTMRSRSASGGG